MSKYRTIDVWNQVYGRKETVYDYAGRLMKKSACGDSNSAYHPTLDHIRPTSVGQILRTIHSEKKDHSRFLRYGLNVMPTVLLLPGFCVCFRWTVLCVPLPSNRDNTSQRRFSEYIAFRRHCIFCL